MRVSISLLVSRELGFPSDSQSAAKSQRSIIIQVDGSEDVFQNETTASPGGRRQHWAVAQSLALEFQAGV